MEPLRKCRTAKFFRKDKFTTAVPTAASTSTTAPSATAAAAVAGGRGGGAAAAPADAATNVYLYEPCDLDADPPCPRCPVDLSANPAPRRVPCRTCGAERMTLYDLESNQLKVGVAIDTRHSCGVCGDRELVRAERPRRCFLLQDAPPILVVSLPYRTPRPAFTTTPNHTPITGA